MTHNLAGWPRSYKATGAPHGRACLALRQWLNALLLLRENEQREESPVALICVEPSPLLLNHFLHVTLRTPADIHDSSKHFPPVLPSRDTALPEKGHGDGEKRERREERCRHTYELHTTYIPTCTIHTSTVQVTKLPSPARAGQFAPKSRHVQRKGKRHPRHRPAPAFRHRSRSVLANAPSFPSPCPTLCRDSRVSFAHVQILLTSPPTQQRRRRPPPPRPLDDRQARNPDPDPRSPTDLPPRPAPLWRRKTKAPGCLMYTNVSPWGACTPPRAPPASSNTTSLRTSILSLSRRRCCSTGPSPRAPAPCCPASSRSMCMRNP